MTRLKPLALALSVSLALAACQKADEPAATAAAPEAPKLQIDLAQVQQQPISLNAGDLDTSIQACQDFNGFVNSKWLAANPVPADRTTWGAFPALGERSLQVQHEIAKAAAAGSWPGGSMEQKVGDFFAAGMDEAAIEAAGIKPIQPFLDEIAALKAPADLPAYLRKTAAEGRMSLISGSGSVKML